MKSIKFIVFTVIMMILLIYSSFVDEIPNMLRFIANIMTIFCSWFWLYSLEDLINDLEGGAD